MLGLKFSRLVHASLAGGSLMLAGCVDRAYDFGDSGSFNPNPDPSGDPDPSGNPDPSGDPNPNPSTTGDPVPPPPDVPGPPRLIAAQFIDNARLVLTFSEAIAPPTSVNPQQFRLSSAFAPQGEYYYQYGTNYQEVGLTNGVDYFCEEYCYEYCYQDECYDRCWEYCYTPPGPPVRVISVDPIPDRPEALVLGLDNPINGGVCSQLNQFPPEWISDLFIHYTPAGTAPITDNAGDVLAPIAEHWALEPNADFAYIEGFFEWMDPVLPIPCPF
ncbi:MAG: hypothetical protein AAGF11_16660 [Myxococcota bacterium]